MRGYTVGKGRIATLTPDFVKKWSVMGRLRVRTRTSSTPKGDRMLSAWRPCLQIVSTQRTRIAR